MKKLFLLTAFSAVYFQIQAQTEKVEFLKNSYECFYCKKKYSLPYLPNIKNVKNEKIKSSLTDQTLRTSMFIKTDVKNSGCMSNLNRSSHHDWREMKPKKVMYTATMVKKEMNGQMSEYADVPEWHIFDEVFGN